MSNRFDWPVSDDWTPSTKKGTVAAVNRSSLGELIDEVKRRTGWSDDEIATTGTRITEVRLTKQDISKWRRGGMKMLSVDKVRALAAGLRLEPYRVAVAALADHGIEIPQDIRSPEDAIHHDYSLTPQARRQLLALLELERHQG